MIEMNAIRKNKISLSDYNYRRDIENRLKLAHLSPLDLEVLEEIVYSSLTISISKLAKNLGIKNEELLPLLDKFSTTGLLSYSEDQITVDKEMRKYYEAQIIRFDEEFRPGMDFLQAQLRKVPIHVLPIWYAIPRTSDNIFESLVEKYLLTPQIFQRYLQELSFTDPHLSAILHDVYNSPDFKVSAQELMQKYSLSREQFEEKMLYLEFNFVCCVRYDKADSHWDEVVVPFHEWREYLIFLRDSEPKSITTPALVRRFYPHDFSFIQDLTTLLQAVKKQPIALVDIPKTIFPKNPLSEEYIQQLINKLCLLKLATITEGNLHALEPANEWLDLRLENKALYIYRHPLNRLLSHEFPAFLCTDRNIREAEKSVKRVLNLGWVYFDDFIKGALIAFNENSIVMLKKVGKSWKYTLPEYTDEERALIKASIFEWLFEVGAVATGTHDGKECFCLTPFGQSLFSR